jgi:hypothetical protein
VSGDLLARLEAAATDPHKHTLDVGHYWNLCEEAADHLRDLYGSDPCPKCGTGVAPRCLGCEIAALRERAEQWESIAQGRLREINGLHDEIAADEADALVLLHEGHIAKLERERDEARTLLRVKEQELAWQTNNNKTLIADNRLLEEQIQPLRNHARLTLAAHAPWPIPEWACIAMRDHALDEWPWVYADAVLATKGGKP